MLLNMRKLFEELAVYCREFGFRAFYATREEVLLLVEFAGEEIF